MIKWGIIGLGSTAGKFAQDIQIVKGTALQAVASRNLERAKKFARKYKIPSAYSTYQALANDPEVDVVYIATPHNLHFEHARLCLEAGKHVLCEKPFTVNAGQSAQLFQLAKQNDLFIMEAMWTYFLPIYRQVRDWLQSGVIGEPILMSSTFGIKPEFDENRRLFNLQLAGGALLDIGVYNLAVSRWITQEEVVSFDVRARIGRTGVDELLAGTLVFPSGAISQFSCSYLNESANDFWIYGSKGRIHISAPFWAATTATLETKRGKKVATRSFRSGGFENEIDEVGRCLRAGILESPVIPHRLTLESMRLMDAIREEIGLVYPFE